MEDDAAGLPFHTGARGRPSPPDPFAVSLLRVTDVESRASDSPHARISSGIVGLLKEFYGKGPEKSRTYIHDDMVVVLTRGGYTRVEQTLLAAGHGDAVIQQRMTFQGVMRERFTAIIEQVTGREVVAFMSGSHQHPDVNAEVFVLAPTEFLD